MMMMMMRKKKKIWKFLTLLFHVNVIKSVKNAYLHNWTKLAALNVILKCLMRKSNLEPVVRQQVAIPISS